MESLERLGGETWFRLGDHDLAMHVERSRRLHNGEGLGTITADVAKRLGIGSAIIPMSDDPVRTLLDTEEGLLPFQNYFVARQAEPAVRGISYIGAGEARAHASVIQALRSPDLAMVVLCPSNPWLSLAPILSIRDLRAAISETSAPVIAVSPIVGGRAIKGPTAKLMNELGLSVTAASVADYYRELIDGFVLDEADASLAETIAGRGVIASVTKTLMTDLASKDALARHVVAFAERLRPMKARVR